APGLRPSTPVPAPVDGRTHVVFPTQVSRPPERILGDHDLALCAMDLVATDTSLNEELSQLGVVSLGVGALGPTRALGGLALGGRVALVVAVQRNQVRVTPAGTRLVGGCRRRHGRQGKASLTCGTRRAEWHVPGLCSAAMDLTPELASLVGAFIGASAAIVPALLTNRATRSLERDHRLWERRIDAIEETYRAYSALAKNRRSLVAKKERPPTDESLWPLEEEARVTSVLSLGRAAYLGLEVR